MGEEGGLRRPLGLHPCWDFKSRGVEAEGLKCLCTQMSNDMNVFSSSAEID